MTDLFVEVKNVPGDILLVVHLVGSHVVEEVPKIKQRLEITFVSFFVHFA